MAKFDIFDENSWHNFDLDDRETILRNKALGQIGNLMRSISDLKDRIQKNSGLNNNKEYLIAQDLKTTYPEVYALMQVNIYYPESEVKDIVLAVDQILSTWKDISNRKERWRSLLEPMKKIKPFLKDHNNRYDSSEANFAELISVKVSGNKAWELYLQTAMSLDEERIRYQKLRAEHPTNYNYDVDDDSI